MALPLLETEAAPILPSSRPETSSGMESLPTDMNTHAPAGSLRELLNVALPLIVSNGSLSLMTVVDRALLARLNKEALAASMPAAMLSWTSMSLFLGIVSYSGAFISQYDGAGRKDRVAASVWQGLFLAIAGGTLLLPMILAAPLLFRAMGHAPDVQPMEVEYFRWLCPVAIPTMMSSVLSAFFACRKRSQVVMWVNAFISIENALLAWLLIFGWGNWSGWGIRGAAIATTFSTATGTALFLYFLRQECRQHGYPLAATCHVDFTLLRRLFRYGMPNGIQYLLDIGAFMLFLALIGQLGTDEQAASNLAFTLNSMAFIPMLGMGTAVLTLVGHRVGEGRPDLAARTVWIAFALSGGLMLAFSALYLTMPETILTPLLSGAEKEDFMDIRPIVVSLLRFVALYTFFDGTAVVFGSAIRGAGDTWFSLAMTVTGGWLLMVVPTVWIVRHGGDLYACWWACTIYIIVLAFLFLGRFLQGKWRRMKVIEPELVAES